jgi:hypothetical protein
VRSQAREPEGTVTVQSRLAGGEKKVASKAKAAAEATPMQAFGRAAGGQIGLGGVGYGGGGAATGRPDSMAKGVSGRGGAVGSAAPATIGDAADIDADPRKPAKQEQNGVHRREAASRETAESEDRGRFAAPPAGPAPKVTASSPAADGAPTEGADRVAEARDQRADGRLPEALAAYRRALAAGLSGDLLIDALAEAAEVAQALGRAAEADGYLARLERLPGGSARAATIRAK